MVIKYDQGETRWTKLCQPKWLVFLKCQEHSKKINKRLIYIYNYIIIFCSPCFEQEPHSIFKIINSA